MRAMTIIMLAASGWLWVMVALPPSTWLIAVYFIMGALLILLIAFAVVAMARRSRQPSGTDFSNTILHGITFEENNMAGVILKKADITAARFINVTGLTQKQVDQAIANPSDPPVFYDTNDARTGMPIRWPAEKNRTEAAR